MKKILLADDSEDLHELFCVLINTKKKVSFIADFFFDEGNEIEEKRNGSQPQYQIEHAFQAEEAITTVIKAHETKEPFDLIFMDMHMPPGIDGITAINRLTKKVPQLKIVVCSTFLQKEWQTIVSELQGDVTLYPLRKPFTSKKIQKILDEALE